MQTFYGEITASIIAELEKGAPPWVKVWDTDLAGFLPTNFATKRPYSGINTLVLWMKALKKGYPSSGWLTFKQALAAGGCVRKGEKATLVVFVKKMTIHEEGDVDDHSITMLKQFYVFNEAQIDGLPEDEPRDPHAPTAVAGFMRKTGATIIAGPDPCYIPSQDVVVMPPHGSFAGSEHYDATMLHETVHWTGAKHRLDRDFTGRFGTRSYAAEELVAELGAAFLCAHLRVHGELRHAGYIGHWLELLKDDPKAIFTASAKASQAAEYLKAFSSSEVPI